MNDDLKHLGWLRTGFLVHGVIVFLFSLIPFIHLTLGIMMVTGNLDEGKNPPPPFLGWFFIGLAGLFIVTGMSIAVCNFIVAKSLSDHSKYVFCIVIAAVNCLFAPFGILLGVFTFLVLLRESVKQLFDKTIQPISVNPPDWR